MTSLVFGIVHAGADPVTLAAAGGGVLLLGVVVTNERRAAQPIMPLRLFAGRERTGAYAVTLPTSPPPIVLVAGNHDQSNGSGATAGSEEL